MKWGISICYADLSGCILFFNLKIIILKIYVYMSVLLSPLVPASPSLRCPPVQSLCLYTCSYAPFLRIPYVCINTPYLFFSF